jgi:hypothetical protein
MAIRSNKTRTYLALKEIEQILESMIHGEEVYLTRLRELLDEMRESVNTTEGEQFK